MVNCFGPQEVTLNFQPSMWPNRVMLHRREAAVAVLTTAAGEYCRATAFDATQFMVDTLRIGTRRIIEGTERGTDRIAQSVFEDSIEAGPPETVQEGDSDLALFNLDADDSGLRLGDTELCVTGFVKQGDGTTAEFFGCDQADVFQ